jgi:hypothetical protein
MKMKTKYTEICECECHREDKQIIHIMPCCSLTYCKYITKDGKIDYIAWAKHYRENTKK